MAGLAPSPSPLFEAAAETFPRRRAGRAGFDAAVDVDGAIILDGVAAETERCMFFFRGNKDRSEERREIFNKLSTDVARSHTTTKKFAQLFPSLLFFFSFRQTARNGLHFVLSRAARAGAAAPVQEQWSSSGAQGRLGEVRFVFLDFDDGGFRISLLPCRRRRPLLFIRVCSFSLAHPFLLYLSTPLPLSRPSSSVTWTAPKIWTPRSERR